MGDNWLICSFEVGDAHVSVRNGSEESVVGVSQGYGHPGTESKATVSFFDISGRQWHHCILPADQPDVPEGLLIPVRVVPRVLQRFAHVAIYALSCTSSAHISPKQTTCCACGALTCASPTSKLLISQLSPTLVPVGPEPNAVR